MLLRITNRLLALCLLTFFSFQLFSQTHSIRFNRLGINDGLSQSTINCILQDKDGYIWVGTQDGLNKYDGYEVVQYKTKLKDKNSIANAFITALYEDKKGGLWIGTQTGGLNFKDKNSEKFKHIQLKGRLTNCLITKIIGDNKKNLWIGTEKYGLIVYNLSDESYEVFNSNNGLSSNNITDLIFYNGKLLISTKDNGVCSFNTENKEIEYLNDWNSSFNDLGVNCFNYSNDSILYIGTNKGVNVIDNGVVSNLSEDLKKYSIQSIYSHDASNIWIGTYGEGLIQYEKHEGEYFLNIYKHNNYDLNSISSDIIKTIYKDVTGNLFVGTQDGLSYFDPIKQSFKHYTYVFGSEESMIDKNAWGIFDQGDSVLWIGNRKGVTRVHKLTNKYYNYPFNETIVRYPNEQDVYDIKIDDQNRIWVATNGGLYQLSVSEDLKSAKYQKVNFRESPNISDDDVVHDLELNDNKLWLGCKEGLGLLDLNTLTPTFLKNGNHGISDMPEAPCRRVYCDIKGKVWLGFEGAGLSIMSIDTISQQLQFSFKNYTSNNKTKSISKNTVLSILEGEQGVFWIGTYGGGLNKFDTKTGEFKYYTEDDGLSNSSIYGILSDEKGSLWISTNFGISVFDVDKEEFKIFTESDGLIGNEFNNGAFHKSSSGEMLFGGINGVNSFYPKEIKENKIPPKVIITDIEFLNNNEYEALSEFSDPNSMDQLVLNYRQNNFMFHFLALHYTHSKGNKYEIHLVGLYDKPLFLDGADQISYSNLAPGEYTFKVRASNNDGVWSDWEKIHIVIQSPFWQKWRFIALIIASSILVFWGFYLLRLRAIKRQKRRLAFLVEKRTKTVTKQKEQIEKQKIYIEKEKNKAEELLLNILPAETAEELKNKGKARTRQYRMATVLFTDIKGFSKITETMKPVDLVKSLDNLFREFDKIIEKHQIEKIKTIGDAYMAAGGVPLRDKENPINCVLAALEIQQFMKKMKEESIAKGEGYWELRIGIHTGDVIAGVIGSKRIAYDIWGNTVNIAQRMESGCDPWRVNISESTHEYVSPYFVCSNRGKIPTKNTGEISMYYVDRIKPHLSKDKDGFVPNKKFLEYVNLHIYSSINYKKAERHIMKILREKLSPNLHYHGIHHTLDVVESVERIAIMEGVLDEDIFVLKSAATYHDAGFVEKYDSNEVVGASMAAEILPKYGYTDQQIKQVWALIYATIIPHKPNDHLEQIICDADLDYLGRDDFHQISDTLRRELRDHGKINSDRLWDEIQVKFLTQHKYFTKSAKKLREKKKQKHLEEIKQRLKENNYKD